MTAGALLQAKAPVLRPLQATMGPSTVLRVIDLGLASLQLMLDRGERRIGFTPRRSSLSSGGGRLLSLQLCDEAIDHHNGSEPEGYSPHHVTDQHTLGAPVGTQRDKRDRAECCSSPVQNRGIVRTAERVAGGVADEERAEKYEQWR